MENEKQVHTENDRQILVKHLFYHLANHHTVLLAGTGCTREDLEECLKEGLSLQQIRAKLFKILDSLERLETRASKAVKSAERIRYHLIQLVA